MAMAFTSDGIAPPGIALLPRQQIFRAMNGAHLASPIRGELIYAHWPKLGSQIDCPIGNQIWGPLGKEDLCPNFALTVGKFVFSNSGNFRAKANPPKHRSCPKLPCIRAINGHNSSADWGGFSISIVRCLELRRGDVWGKG